MSERVAAFIVNYNMPERADALAQHIKNTSAHPVDVYLIDNGSDIMPPAENTNVRLEKNVQTTNGWLCGLKAADKKAPYFAYWFLITSAEFVDAADPLTPMVEFLQDNGDAVGIHPALTADSTTAWAHLYDRKTGLPRRTWMIDNIASLYKAEWFDSIGRFDAELVYGWGIDLETCYLARKAGKSLWVDERVQIKKVTDIGYAMDRMNMKAHVRRVNASKNMQAVLSKRYGSMWRNEILGKYRTAEMK